MKYVDEYRDAQRCQSLVHAIRSSASRPWRIMEVCGGQTHGLLRWGIDQQLSGAVELLHGPGCPVCVTPSEAIDQAIALARQPGCVVTSFGDMLRVPGSRESLLTARSSGARVQLVYSPLDAVRLAEAHPELQVVFFAVGFETTVPATALAVQQAARKGLENFTLLVAHVRVQPAMEHLLAAQPQAIDGFLAAGHVCTVTGYESYHALCAARRVPVVVTGFEPVDLLLGLAECVRQLEADQSRVVNCYPRCVQPEGNPHAVRAMQEVYEPCDLAWRGLGVIPQGGLRLRGAWRRFDARHRLATQVLPVIEPTTCRGGEVLAGAIKPPECAEFGQRCTPDGPLGAPMVSSEGACAAYYRFARGADRVSV